MLDRLKIIFFSSPSSIPACQVLPVPGRYGPAETSIQHYLLSDERHGIVPDLDSNVKILVFENC